MSEQTPETFNTNVLPDISPFTIDWLNVSTQKRTSKNGGLYTIYLLPCLGQGLQSPILVEAFKQTRDRLRILNLSGIKRYTATWGIAAKEGARAPMILSGVNAEK